MNTRSEIAARLLDPPLIAVVRATRTEQVVPLSRALLAGGIVSIEVTMTTPNALTAIRDVVRSLPSHALIGAGTVLDADTCRMAIEAGAHFVVSPITRPEIATMAHRFDKVVMLGAYTPTEAQLAYEAGADFIKLFPADGLGPGYIKALRAPLPHLKIVPTGGITLETAADFLKAGCKALGLGSALLSADLLAAQNWPALTERARQFVAVVRSRKKGTEL